MANPVASYFSHLKKNMDSGALLFLFKDRAPIAIHKSFLFKKYDGENGDTRSLFSTFISSVKMDSPPLGVYFKNLEGNWVNIQKLGDEYPDADPITNAELSGYANRFPVSKNDIPSVEYTDGDGFVHYINEHDGEEKTGANPIEIDESRELVIAPFSMENPQLSWNEREMMRDLAVTATKDGYTENILTWLNGRFLAPTKDNVNVNRFYIRSGMDYVDSWAIDQPNIAPKLTKRGRMIATDFVNTEIIPIQQYSFVNIVGYDDTNDHYIYDYLFNNGTENHLRAIVSLDGASQYIDNKAPFTRSISFQDKIYYQNTSMTIKIAKYSVAENKYNNEIFAGMAEATIGNEYYNDLDNTLNKNGFQFVTSRGHPKHPYLIADNDRLYIYYRSVLGYVDQEHIFHHVYGTVDEYNDEIDFLSEESIQSNDVSRLPNVTLMNHKGESLTLKEIIFDDDKNMYFLYETFSSYDNYDSVNNVHNYHPIINDAILKLNVKTNTIERIHYEYCDTFHNEWVINNKYTDKLLAPINMVVSIDKRGITYIHKNYTNELDNFKSQILHIRKLNFDGYDYPIVGGTDREYTSSVYDLKNVHFGRYEMPIAFFYSNNHNKIYNFQDRSMSSPNYILSPVIAFSGNKILYMSRDGKYLRVAEKKTIEKYNPATYIDEDPANDTVRFDRRLRLFKWNNVKVNNWVQPVLLKDYPVLLNEDDDYVNVYKEITFSEVVNPKAHMIINNGRILPENDYYIDPKNPKKIILKRIQFEAQDYYRDAKIYYSNYIPEGLKDPRFMDPVDYVLARGIKYPALEATRTKFGYQSYSLVNFEAIDGRQIRLIRQRNVRTCFPYHDEIAFDELGINDIVIINGYFTPYEWKEDNVIKLPITKTLPLYRTISTLDKADVYRIKFVFD